jgi:hypothetical protein
MAFSLSGAFKQTFLDDLNATIVLNLDLETHRGALFGNSPTAAASADYDIAASAAKYGAGGTFTTANEVTGTGYTAGGALLTSTALSGVAGGIVMWDAADLAWAGATFSNAYGVLLYADALTTPIADQAIMAVAFGAAYGVTAGTFTIQWDANGVLRLDYA